MSVGNDVVDLSDPETDLRRLHPRFAERVFTANERDALAAAGDRDTAPPDAERLRHWAFWAAKESAYKAQKRLAPATVFSPRAFEVTLSPWARRQAASVATGSVLHRGRRFEVEVVHAGASLHAIATSAGPGIEPWSQLDRARGEPSLAVRHLASQAIGSALNLDPTGIEIMGRPPTVRYGSRRLDLALSLSHHGRFVAFACALTCHA